MAKISVLDKQQRKGTIQSTPCRIPMDINTPIEFHALLDKVDLEDETLRLKIDVEISDDDINWRYFGGVVYIGGVYEPEGIPGFGIYNGASLANKYIRMKIHTNKKIVIGAEVEMNKSRVVISG